MADLKSSMKTIISHYERFDEPGRLSTSHGRLEFARSKEIVSRYLPAPPAVVLDVGGASGRYACWLAAEGYEVHLIDLVQMLVVAAEKVSRNQPGSPIRSCEVGDARALAFADSVAHAVLMFGPLYHLVERAERLQALSEAFRVLRPGGWLFAVGISRFASAVDGLGRGFIQDEEFVKIMNRDLEDGQHRNHTDNALYFTDAFFHHPDELRGEVEEAGFQVEDTLAVDGLGWMTGNLDQLWRDAALRQSILRLLRRLESEPTLIGASPHMMTVARAPAQ